MKRISRNKWIHRLPAFLKPLLNLFYKGNRRKHPIFKSKLKPEMYERLPMLSDAVYANLTGNLKYKIPPDMLQELKQATSDLQDALEKYNQLPPATRKARSFLLWIRSRWQLALRLLF